jgi:hypothetical protein
MQSHAAQIQAILSRERDDLHVRQVTVPRVGILPLPPRTQAATGAARPQAAR